MFGLGGHIFDIFILLFIALLVFGPKRMIDMGSSFGKAFRELRDATKDMNWTSLIHDDGASAPKPGPTPFRPTTSSTTSQPPEPSTVVESTIEEPERSE
jgi:TatA/E family protein of Tat protein translocase